MNKTKSYDTLRVEAIRVLYSYTVESAFPFPVDMLRYDMAWPADETEAATINLSIRGHVNGKQQVKVRGLRPPTEGRWESFLWKVLSLDQAEEAARK